jgi:sugar lactone lactonase YvrE
MRAFPSCTLSAFFRSTRISSATRHMKELALLALICGAMAIVPASAQVAGQNVNMVSGTGWTNGDPFLERQNEPSITVSTRNSSHLFGAANDYRSVDLPGLLGIDERGDAWLGVYKSFDGGLTWKSTLLPGFPLDGSPEGIASPIHGRQAAADPLVRAGSNGLFFLTGLAFDRGSSPLSKVFITRFIDLNNKENGDAASENGSLTNLAPRDPVKYIDTRIIDTGSPNRFLDKPWVAVDIPRDRATCTISANEDGNSVTQRIPAGAIYVTYTAFTTVGTVQNSQILFRRSTDCGATWSKPIVLSQNDDSPVQQDAEGQGTVIAIDPSVSADQPARIYVAWRVFAQPNDPDDANQIRIARSNDGGQSFDEQESAVTFPLSCNKTPTSAGCPFDQGESGTSFRSNGYPALTVDNVGRIYLAWSQRDANGDGRIMMTVTNRVESWPKSNFREIDSGPVYDDYGAPFSTLSNRGSQLMPTLNLNAGKLMLTYYDLRQDHTSGALTPAPEPTCNPAITPLCPIGNPFSELRQLEAELLTNPLAVFNAYVDDATLTVRRHTLDIIGSEGTPESDRWSLAVPSFSHFRVSSYQYGIIPPGANVQQAQFNAPNLPMFVQGTAPFMGDYIDVAGAPSMVPDNTRGRDSWKFNTDPITNPVFHATWTDNRDVQPPPDGVSWNKYTPPISASIGPTSKFDPTQTPPACVSGYSGMRNQNIYTSAISHGLILTSPQTAKPVLQSNGQPIPREFSLIMRNDTNLSREFQLTIPAQPATAEASFLQFSLQNALTLNIPAFSSASRPVFLTPNAGSTMAFPSFEVDATETDGTQPPLTASILFNADPTNPFLANPDDAAFGASSISSQEFYNPAILNPAILNPAILNPAILNPAILNPAILNPAILNPAILNPAILNPNFVVALNPAILNPAILNPAILNNAVANPAILNPAILNTPVSDANYTITNQGNTSATYQLQLFQSGPLPASAVFQIILTKTYLTPGVSPTDGCTYGGQVNNEVIASIDNPAFVTNPAQLGNPAILNSAINNPTFSMAPGDTVQVTLRANLTVTELATVVLPNLTPVVAAQAVNTVDVEKGITTPPISLLISTTSVPTAVTGQAYSTSLAALGGNPPSSSDVWSLVGGSLPPGLNLSAAGVISGTATATGTYPFVAEVMDTGTPQHTASRQLSITVVAPVAITTPAPALPEGGAGALYTQAFTATGGVPPYTWTSTGALPPGLTLSSTGTLSGVPTTGGTYNFTVRASDSIGLVASMPYTVVITNTVPAGAQLQFVSQPTTPTAGQTISPAIQVQILNATGAAVPDVPVTLGVGTGQNRPILSGTLSALTDASGIAMFSNVFLDRAGTGFTLIASAAGVSSSGAVQLIAAPPSVQQGALESDTQIQLFSERRGVTLATGVAVDITSPGNYSSSAGLTSGTISAGTLVDSYYLHADPVGISHNIVQLQAGGVTFPTPVLGVIVLDPEFNASDATLGVASTLYPASGRSLTLGSPTDTAILSPDGRTLTLQLSDSSATADVRVITAANSSSIVQVTSAPFNSVAGNGFITTVAGSTWTFPSEVSPANAPLGLGADMIDVRAGVVADSLGNVYVADPNNHMVFKISDGTFSIVAGTGVEGYFGDGGPATAARLDFPDALALSPSGELYIADGNNSVIRKVDKTGKITTVVGNGVAAYSGDGGQAVNASLNFPEGITFDSSGDLFIADSGNVVIRKVDTSGVITTLPITTVPANSGLCSPEDVVDGPSGNLYIADTCRDQIFKLDSGGNLTVVAGNGSPGYSGDGGPALNASLSLPITITFDPAGNLYIADQGNNVTRKVNTTGTITTVVGNSGPGFSGDGGSGLLASLAQPGALIFDPFGNLDIADMANERIRRVAPSGTITTIAGNGKFEYAGDGGPATSASLDSPVGTTVDPAGNLFAADIANHVVRKIDPAGLISTYAGTGVLAPTYTGDGGPAISASLVFPDDVKADGAGNVYVSEGGRVHKISPSGVITTLLGGPSNSGAFSLSNIENDGLSRDLRIALDSQGDVYISDPDNFRVLKLDTTGALTVVAGIGKAGFSGDGGPATLASLGIVRDVAIDLAGNLYIADQGNGRVRRVDPTGVITTVAGNGSTTVSGDGGAATSAGLPGPFALTVDGVGNLFIGSAGRVRKVDASGTITTIAGGGFIGPTVDGIPATNAAFTNVQGLAFDAAGNLYLTDRLNNRLRKITGVTNAPPFLFNPPSGLTVITKGLPRGDAGSPYFQTLSAVGGAAPYTWSIVSGALPAGLSLSSAGVISGTPTTAGSSTFTVTVTDSSTPPQTASQNLTINVVVPLTITTTNLPAGTTGIFYSANVLTSDGIGTVTESVTAGALPTGLALSSAGLLSGTPSAAGTFTFTVTATDQSLPPQTASQSYTITVAALSTIGNIRVAQVAYTDSATPVAVTWNPPFADTNYTTVCTAETQPSDFLLPTITSRSPGAMTVSPTDGGSPAGILNCMAVPDSDSSDVRRARVAYSGFPASVVMTWNAPFADLNYTPVCTAETEGPFSGGFTSAITAESTNAVTVLNDGFDSGTMHCIAVPDSDTLGFRHARAGFASPQTSPVLLTWNTPFRDANYAAVCYQQDLGISSTDAADAIQAGSRVAASIYVLTEIPAGSVGCFAAAVTPR